MNGQKQKFSELKKQAREAMAGRCGTLVGATAINLFLTFSCSRENQDRSKESVPSS